MTLTVETGTGASDADALVTLAYFKSYADALGWDYSAYDDEDDLEPAIRRATAYLSDAYAWDGLRTHGRSQALAWPRTGITDNEGLAVSSDEIPTELKKAVSEVTWREVQSPNAMTPDYTASGAVKSETIGAISVEYVNGATSAQSQVPVILMVRDLIGPFLKSGGVNPIVGVSVRA